MNERDGTAGALELPVVALPGTHPCASCGECCTYVATQIDDPQSFGDYENVHWYLLHENVGVYIDWDGDWYIEFKTRCRNLTDARTCASYATRPRVCSEFSWTECEKNAGEKGWKHYFESWEELLDFMRVRRPKAFARYMKKRREVLRKRERAAGAGRAARGSSAAPTSRA